MEGVGKGAGAAAEGPAGAVLSVEAGAGLWPNDEDAANARNRRARIHITRVRKIDLLFETGPLSE